MATADLAKPLRGGRAAGRNPRVPDHSNFYLGSAPGLPPRVPGGGMTGIGALVDGGLLTIPGSTPFGGQITPFDSESRSPSGGLGVASPARGGGVASDRQSGWVDGAVGGSFWAYRGEIEIAARIVEAIAALLKLRIAVLHAEETRTSRPFYRERT